ncbi:MAG: J domain-containing protein [Chloroflexi bacterium]|nr:J domain-containing protein [Chloroflexota bacterium]
MSLQVAFNDLVERLRGVRTVKNLRVRDQGTLMLELEQPGFIESVIIYLIAGELSVGFIKKAVNNNTHADINTLLIVSSDLLPADGAYAQPTEALRLLLALYSGKIYAYSVVGQAVRIFPVYISREKPVSYGAEVELSNLGIDYAEIYSNHIWGVRKVADFTARYFEYRASSPPPRQDPLQAFYDLLDVPLTASPAEIKKAYRKKARQHHPDADRAPDATQKMQRINEAYEKIMQRFEA